MKPGGKLVSEEVAGSIVRFVAGGAELANAEVEPALLSLICRELNNARIAQGRGEISADLLAGSRDTILTEFYERALADQPPGVRQFIEDNLLTESGHRESLAEERVQKGLGGGRRAARYARHARQPPAAAHRGAARRAPRRVDARRADAVSCARAATCGSNAKRATRPSASSPRSASANWPRARRWCARGKIAAVCAVLAIWRCGSAVFGYLSMKRAQEAEAKSEQTRLMAEQARGESEKLVVYLLDDFYLELAPVGRLDIVGALAKRALDYYNALPRGAAHAADRAQPRAGAGALRHRFCARRRGSTKATRPSTRPSRCWGRCASRATCRKPPPSAWRSGLSTKARLAIERRQRRQGTGEQRPGG